MPRDFVEYPSQVNEMWQDDPEVARTYARHNVPGEPPKLTIQQTDVNVAGGKLAVPPLSVVMYRLDLR